MLRLAGLVTVALVAVLSPAQAQPGDFGREAADARCLEAAQNCNGAKEWRGLYAQKVFDANHDLESAMFWFQTLVANGAMSQDSDDYHQCHDAQVAAQDLRVAYINDDSGAGCAADSFTAGDNAWNAGGNLYLQGQYYNAADAFATSRDKYAWASQNWAWGCDHADACQTYIGQMKSILTNYPPP